MSRNDESAATRGVVITQDALDQVLAALAGLTNAVSGRADRDDERQPSADQARVILDYGILNGLLGRADGTIAVIRAERDGDKITLLDPLPTGATQLVVTPASGATEQVPIDTTDNSATLQTTPRAQPLVRVELQTAAGIPVALGPRLPAAFNGVVE